MARFNLKNGGIRTSKKSGQKSAGAEGKEAQTVKASLSRGAKEEKDKRVETNRAVESAAADADRELSMSVSPVCGEAGSMYAFVRFEDGKRYCEYRFPDVELKVNDGFSEEELVQLKFYVAGNIPQLKKMAASVDPLKALMKG